MKATAAVAKDVSLADLLEEHRRLDERVRSLDGQRSLTPAEQREYLQLKKMKLLTKDRIERLRLLS